ncbi:hypothetical protein [Bradyrhizobium erythrophlei]|nr:hypothetical protein [Bradyrhizobium erythrophlei]
MQWLAANCTLVISDYHREFCVRFDRSDVSAVSLKNLRKHKGWKTGRNGRFTTEPPTHPNSAAARFKKDHRIGAAALKYRPIGSERLTYDGYPERKVHDGLPRRKQWQLIHVLNWEQRNGPIPAGFALKCKGDKANPDPSNWDLIPRSMLPRLNGRHGRKYDEAPSILKPTIMAVVKLEDSLRRSRRDTGVDDRG